MPTPLYDDLSPDYDRFVRWERRLAFELPFLEEQLRRVGARRVLDVACGTGRHALALAQRGYEVVGADASRGMLDQARVNAAAAGVEVTFVEAGFGALRAALDGTFDAVLCLGNSLPHALTLDALSATLRDWAALLRPNGLALIQSRNYDQVVAQRHRWMAPQSHAEGERAWVFVRFYDFEGDGTLTFNVLTLYRTGDAPWAQRATATTLRPWTQAELVAELARAGYGEIVSWGDMAGAPFAEGSPNLVIGALAL
ncbi:MAG: class I SAM-dependent methyltransferase [Anaerolineae bacterium]|nr:class I SAM-dependent methyltransferase [Anaerolineae bacterium]